jgi:hypothetical protein
MNTNILFQTINIIIISNLSPMIFKFMNAAPTKLVIFRCDRLGVRKGDNQMVRCLGNMEGGIKFPNQALELVPGHSCV